MGNCVARSPRIQQNRNSNSNSSSNNNGGKELISSAATVPPENDASLSPPAIRSRELLQMAEPSDGSFALLYPELEFTKQELPNNGIIDPITVISSAAAAAVEEAVGQAPPPTRRDFNDGNIAAPRTLKPSTANNPIGTAASSSSRPARIYAREA